MEFNLIDLDKNETLKDKKKITIIKNLRKKSVILKPDKGNTVVLIKTSKYYAQKNGFQVRQNVNR